MLVIQLLQGIGLRRSFTVSVLGFALLGAGPAFASGLMECESGDRSAWQSEAVLTEKLVAEGWEVRKTEVDHGCYEVYGTTPEGDRVEAYFHPQTLEKLLVARRGEILFRKESESDASPM